MLVTPSPKIDLIANYSLSFVVPIKWYWCYVCKIRADTACSGRGWAVSYLLGILD
jgi:hypothetical protein